MNLHDKVKLTQLQLIADFLTAFHSNTGWQFTPLPPNQLSYTTRTIAQPIIVTVLGTETGPHHELLNRAQRWHNDGRGPAERY